MCTENPSFNQGFLSTGDKFYSGNWGLKDQALAIDWVLSHVSKFGGDNKRVVLMGQSAGAVSVHLQMMSPVNKGKLFAAIALSNLN
jgi:carboxylesterase type B